jgi:zinc transport system substrate-binding protein
MVALAWLGWVACGVLAEGGPVQGKIPVAATILPLADFCKQIGGDRVEVQTLIPPGASEHTYEPSPSVVAKAVQARVFVHVGAGMEPWAERLLRSRDAKDLVVVEAVHGIDLVKDVGGKGHEHEAVAGKGEAVQEAHSHEGGNPHVWLDPVLAQTICGRIFEAFVQVDPDHRETYEANLRRYLGELQALDREIRERVSTFRIRDYVAFHPAYVYLARRYGLREVGVIELSPGREPTPRHIQRIVKAIRDHDIRVIFAEPQLSPRVAETIAREAGVRVLSLDPLGGRPPYGSDYIRLMRYNLAVLEEAMGGK